MEDFMERILAGAVLIIAAAAVMIAAGGLSGGPEARRARIMALGRTNAIFVLGATFGLAFAGLILLVSPDRSFDDLKSQVVITGISLACGMLFGWRMISWAEKFFAVPPKQNEEKDG
jgi:hypothetical protein